jgi:hypothetical protein
MSSAAKENEIVGKHGDKMIEVRVRFWTDSIAPTKKAMLQKHIWDSGTVDMPSNESHRIKGGKTIPFNSILDLQSVIGELLTSHGISMHAGRKLRKLLQPTPKTAK